MRGEGASRWWAARGELATPQRLALALVARELWAGLAERAGGAEGVVVQRGAVAAVSRHRVRHTSKEALLQKVATMRST